MIKTLAAAALLLAATGASAQTVTLQPAASNVLRTGTPVALRLIESVSTKDKMAHINDRVRMELAEAVQVNGTVIIPAGSPAVGELTEVRNKGMWGKSGRIIGRVLTVNANGRTIRLSGTFDSKGGSGTGAAVGVSAIVFAPAGFFMTGKSAALPAGSIVRGFVDEDVQFAMAMPVSAPAATPVARRRR